MILMFLFVQGLVDLMINLVDLILNHKIRLIRQITLDYHQDCLQLLHLLVEREQERWINRGIDRACDHNYQIFNFHTPMSDGDDDQPPQTRRQRQRSTASITVDHPRACYRSRWGSHSCESLIINRNLTSSRAMRSQKIQIACAYASTNTSTYTFTIWPAVVPPHGEPQIQPLASQDTDEESETVEPQTV